MIIKLNGESFEIVDNNCTLKLLVEKLETPTLGVAISKNGEIVPKSSWDKKKVEEGDSIEIVQAIPGG